MTTNYGTRLMMNWIEDLTTFIFKWNTRKNQKTYLDYRGKQEHSVD